MVDVQHLTKSFGGVHALRDVSLALRAGEIHALCGENGAGKSTLIKCLAGVVSPDCGTIRVDGVPLRPGSVRASEELGIAVIHQEPVAFPDLNAVDNIFVGREPRLAGGLFLDRREMRRRTAELMQRLGQDIDLQRPVAMLSLAQRQMIAMARALSLQCTTFVLDEPTASLSDRETATLKALLDRLRSEGLTILYVSHRLEEVFEIADRVSVLRDGALVDTRPVDALDRAALIGMMVGREVDELTQRHNPPPAEPRAVLEVADLQRVPHFEGISFTVHEREIVGLAGLVGAGRSEVARAIFGIDSYDSGAVRLLGSPLPPVDPAAAIRRGMALIPEDRHSEGLLLDMSVRDNLSLAILPSLCRYGLIDATRQQDAARRLIETLHIRTPSADDPAHALSGGNQQKLVIGKWLATQPRLLIMDEPTRGIDVGAKAEVHRLIRQLAADGAAVLLISSDLPEIQTLCHRIVVMRRGRIAGTLGGREASREALLGLALPDAPGTPHPDDGRKAL